ncbi:hypothetical protein Ddc_24853 [Ditylenchus destructor]|nr:hypothetical protein Ddc_24853 [Ditylenchus destructor]
MRRSAGLAEKQSNLENESQEEPKYKKSRLNDRITTIATLDNDTMVESFKFLNYCQLAKKSLVSKRFCDLIQAYRHKLALLYISSINLNSISIPLAAIKIFNKELSSEEYNEWVVRNNYLKQIPLEDEVASTQITQIIPHVYGLSADAYYKDSNHRKRNDSTNVFSAGVELNHDNWPAFQHFIRLVTDPFIYIDHMALAYQNDVLNLLVAAINPNHDYLQCKLVYFNRRGNSQKSLTWAKNHLRCNHFYIFGEADLTQDEAFLDFVVTGAHCTSSIRIDYRVHSKAVVNFVQKFMDLKTAHDSQLVEAIKGKFKNQVLELFMRDYAEFIVKEDRNHRDTEQVFEFVNNDIGKKLQLTAQDRQGSFVACFSIKINNL